MWNVWWWTSCLSSFFYQVWLEISGSGTPQSVRALLLKGWCGQGCPSSVQAFSVLWNLLDEMIPLILMCNERVVKFYWEPCKGSLHLCYLLKSPSSREFSPSTCVVVVVFLCFSFLHFFVSWGRLSLCWLAWAGTHNVHQTGLNSQRSTCLFWDGRDIAHHLALQEQELNSISLANKGYLSRLVEQPLLSTWLAAVLTHNLKGRVYNLSGAFLYTT